MELRPWCSCGCWRLYLWLTLVCQLDVRSDQKIVIQEISTFSYQNDILDEREGRVLYSSDGEPVCACDIRRVILIKSVAVKTTVYRGDGRLRFARGERDGSSGCSWLVGLVEGLVRRMYGRRTGLVRNAILLKKAREGQTERNEGERLVVYLGPRPAGCDFLIRGGRMG
jgi:hypothetical protein